MNSQRPVVLCFSGHDPSGGAGIQADIETVISHQCHCCSVITALTEQDTRNVKKLLPQRPEEIIAQADTLLADFRVAAIKIGLIGHADTARALQQVLSRHPGIPVVLDPVLAAGGGQALADAELPAAIKTLLLPLVTVLTPNSPEARQLTGLDALDDCGLALQDLGAENVLITGSHEDTGLVRNILYMPGGGQQAFDWQRLPHGYHGSGCTLAAAIAALLAQGLDAYTAVSEAQDFTWQALQAAYRPGQGQHNPNRLFWVEA